MKKLLFTLLIISFIKVSGQIPEADIIGNIQVQPITHGSLALEYNNTTIYVDPFGDPVKYESLNAPDIVLITDIHGDHYNEDILKKLSLTGTTFIAPPAVAELMNEQWKQQTIILQNGESKEINGINFTAIPMYNLPETGDSRHPKGRGNGYVLSMDAKKIYISGDTEDIPEMRMLKNIDIAFVCMNLPYTMDINQAADAVLEFKPEIIYPYHYRGNPDMSDVEKFKSLITEKNKEIDVRLRNWYL